MSMKIPIMNGSGAFGRVAGTYLAGLYGPFDLQVGCTLVTAATIWAVLGVSVVKFNKSDLIPFNVDMNFRNTCAALVLVSVLYGIFSSACKQPLFAPRSPC